jgi:protein TonB
VKGDFEFKKRNFALRRAGAIAVVVALAVGIALLLKGLLASGEAKRKDVVHQVMLVKPPPPPPPPPKPPEKPPDMKKEEVKIEQKPVEQPKAADAPPEGKQLGVDADGTGPGDGFGLVGVKGGRDLLAGGGSKHGYYAGLIQAHLQEALARNRKLREKEFRVVVSVWLKPDGAVQRTEVVGSSGRAETDELIKLAFAELAALREAPPSDLPQPVRVRVTNRM